MTIQDTITHHIKTALNNLYHFQTDQVELQPTRKEFEGDITLVIFPYVKQLKKAPDMIAQELGTFLQENVSEITNFNVVKGFLNLVISDAYFIQIFNAIKDQVDYGFSQSDKNEPAIMVEYSSPNTNKPLHLGHIRNNLLGYSVSEILKASGKNVIKTQIINDRGIHICKSMLAWQKFGEGETPESAQMKGDKLVGKYYVIFDKAYKEEMKILEFKIQNSDFSTLTETQKNTVLEIQHDATKTQEEKEEALQKFIKLNAPILLEAQDMLRKWEAGDEEVVALWKTMNAWVYDGFDITYKNLGVDFDFQNYESQTYLLGKDIVEKALQEGILYQKEDGSVWCDLSAEKMDDKLLLRGDGTSVYMTQDLGTAVRRHEDYNIDTLIYTVGNEQNHHFKVLFTILKKLGYDWADKLHHLSYGMVNLADGSRMKSREGTVVDADDLMIEMSKTAEEIALEAGKLDQLSEQEKKDTYNMVGMGALKYFILKVDPKKTIKFDPKETIDFNGNTGPFIQYTHARICSLLRKGKLEEGSFENYTFEPVEKEIFKQITEFPSIIQLAAKTLSPALIANYIYDLVKLYNNFYQNVPIFKEENHEKQQFRLHISQLTGTVIKNGMQLLGIGVPERM
ncbi:arginine--tRNA ligase [Flavobacteriaceae bacterium UJ101]|nr:arginine--tRNA ligase [Flavobacteriaceae bacterium UJ101]